MKTKRKTATKGKRGRAATKRGELPRLSRALLEKSVADLEGRIGTLLEDANAIASAIAKVAAPTGQTLVSEWPMRRVIEIAMDVHVGGLSNLLGFAKIINRRP
jgi:hypothetical protein